jgi:very-short-patch-repair endonuclease
MSLPEVLLWVQLRARQPEGPRIRRQHPIGPWVIDFFCSDANLAIEIDGEAHSMGDQPRRDERKDDYLRRLGIDVLRIPAIDVLKDPSGVAMGIFDACRAPPQSAGPAVPPTAPPHAGEHLSLEILPRAAGEVDRRAAARRRGR